jgi:hypothetical protein
LRGVNKFAKADSFSHWDERVMRGAFAAQGVVVMSQA